MPSHTTTKNAVLCGYYGQQNVGDDALLATLLQMLPDGVKPLVLSANPKYTREQFQVPAFPNRSAFSILKALSQGDYFFWGGGSLMQDVTSWRNPIYYAGLMGLAQQRGLTSIAWAQGVGPLRSRFSRWLTRRALLGCAGISVRDHASAELLTEWGLSPLIAPDPVWALESQSFPEIWELPSPKVAVTLREHPQLTRQHRQTLTKALSSFQQASETFILLVPFQPQDQPLVERVASQLPANGYKVIPPQSPKQLKGLFQNVEMAIGMRYHSLIMAAAQECLCFGISYDPKITQLMTELNFPFWELSQLPSNASDMTKAWLDHYAHGAPLTTDQIESQRDRAQIHQYLLLDIFQS